MAKQTNGFTKILRSNPNRPSSSNLVQGSIDSALAANRPAARPSSGQSSAMQVGNAITDAVDNQRSQNTYARDAAAYVAANQANTNSGGGGGGGNRSTGSGPVGDNGQALRDAAAASIRGTIGTVQTGNQTAYDEAKAKVAQQYQEAENNRQKVYAENQAPVQENLANLGMDFASTDLAKDWNANNKYMADAAGTALATDQAWFDKAKLTNDDIYNSLLVELAQQEALANANAASGGGGGGGGGGGYGGGKSKAPYTTQTDTSTLTEDEMMYNPQLIEAINGVSDPRQREFLLSQYDLGGGQVNNTLQNIAKAQLGLATPADYGDAMRNGGSNGFTNILGAPGKVDRLNAQRAKSLDDYAFAQEFMRQYSPNYAPTVTKQSNVTKSGQSTKTKIPVPPAKTPTKTRSKSAQAAIDRSKKKK